MSLQARLSWTKSPLIVNAPMGGFATAELAIAVSKAGGLGQIGAVEDVDNLSSQLARVEQELGRQGGLLPIGVGLLSFVLTRQAEAALAVLQKFQPAVIWIFAAHSLADYAAWAQSARKASPQSQIWIQVGSVEGALTIAKDTKPDVICLQGIDAGGHGFEKGAGVISLVPEAADALAAAGYGNIPLVAAGGIANGRAAAAALTLGAQGVVLGTRFLSANETVIHPAYRAAILAASDGGQSTVRAKLFDELRGPNKWPVLYDGRSLRNESFQNHQDGVDIEEIRKRHADSITDSNGGFAPNGGGRAAIWAGTGVGLVQEQQSAAEIVEEVRAGIIAAIEAVQAGL